MSAIGELKLGSSPRFPAASTKRGMARAIEIVQWMQAYHEARAAECLAAGRLLTAEVFKTGATYYSAVVDALRGELRPRR